MRTVNLYEVGEEVMVKAKITDLVVEDGEVKYRIKNVLTGKDYGYLFKSEDIFPEASNSKASSFREEKPQMYKK